MKIVIIWASSSRVLSRARGCEIKCGLLDTVAACAPCPPANVNTVEVPYNRHPGDLPALDETEIQDVLASFRP
jgi:hypothetical protein